MARVLMSKAMRIEEAKKYVAGKLGISPVELADTSVMREIREELNIGHVLARPGAAIGIEAKVRIEKLLDIKIKSVQNFRNKSGMS